MHPIVKIKFCILLQNLTFYALKRNIPLKIESFRKWSNLKNGVIWKMVKFDESKSEVAIKREILFFCTIDVK